MVDDHGAILSIELVLTTTIVFLGSIVGLTSFRDAIVQEFGDVSAAASRLNHSYKITDVSFSSTLGNVNVQYQVAGSGYSDSRNAGEPTDPDAPGLSPMCLEITSTLIIQENQLLP